MKNTKKDKDKKDIVKERIKPKNFNELIKEIKQIRTDYNENSGWFYGFNERFDEVVDEINAILGYLKTKEEEKL